MKALLALLLAPALSRAGNIQTVPTVTMPGLRLDASAAAMPSNYSSSFRPPAAMTLLPVPSILPAAQAPLAPKGGEKGPEAKIQTALEGFSPARDASRQKAPGLGADITAGSVKFDGAFNYEGPMPYEALQDPVVPYLRSDWKENLDAEQFSIYSKIARRHFEAMQDGSQEESQLQVQAVSLYHSMLAAQGAWVVPTAFKGLDGQPAVGVQILPNPRGHRLNKLAARMPEVKVVYAPRITAYNAAQFAIIGDQPYLFLPNLDMPFTAESIRHELKHYGFFRKILSGKFTWVQAYFTPKAGMTTAPDAKIYAQYIALEELATYAQQARDMLKAAAKGAPGAENEARTQLNILQEVTRIARHVVTEAQKQAPAAPMGGSRIGERSAFLEAHLDGGRLAFLGHPDLLSDDGALRRAVISRLGAWERHLDGIEPLVDELKAAADGENPDWKALARKGDGLLKALK
jgi:hypothetical protein